MVSLTMTEKRARSVLTAVQFWFALVFVFFFGLLIYVLILNGRTLRDEAIRIAEAQATKQAAVQRCLASRPLIIKFSRHLEGVNALANTQVINSTAIIKATPKSDPEYKTRVRNRQRTIIARNKIASLKSIPVPTVKQCRTRGS